MNPDIIIDDGVPYSTVCSRCVHWRPTEGGGVNARRCAAFPKEIPPDIWAGYNRHLQPVPGDNGIMFEQVKGDHDASTQD